MIRCVAYARVSTDKDDQLNSFENQHLYFQQEVSKWEGHELLKIYADRGVSGTKLSRPQFNEMLKDAGLDIVEVQNETRDNRKQYKRYITVPSSREPKFDVILVKDTSRFARNILVEQILRDLRQVGVFVRFLDINKSTEREEDSTFLQFFSTFDEMESRRKSVKVRTGIIAGAKKGKINTNSKLYGYRYIQHENRLEIIPEEAEVIKKIFSLYSEGLGFRRIINRLTDEKIFTREGKPFGKTTIRKIINNEKYAGINIRMKYDTGTVFNKNSYPKVRPADQWIETPTDKIPAIITKELFYKCKEMLNSNVHHKQQVGLYKGTTEYAGKLVCGKCGSPYISNVDRGRRFYNCRNKKLHGVQACDNKNISLATLNSLYDSDAHVSIKHGLKNIGVKALEKLAEKYQEQLNNPNFAKIDELQAQLESVKHRRKKLFSLFATDRMTQEEFDEEAEPLNKERDTLEKQIQSLKMPREELERKIEEVTKEIQRLQAEEIKDHYTHEEILSDIDKITVHPDNKITISFKVAYEIDKLELDDFNITISYA